MKKMLFLFLAIQILLNAQNEIKEEYLIITRDMFLIDELTQFVNSKKSQGTEVSVITLNK